MALLIHQGQDGWYITDNEDGQIINVDQPFRSFDAATEWLRQPWTCETAKYVRADDSRVLINGEPPPVGIRLLSDENFKKAMYAINLLTSRGEL